MVILTWRPFCSPEEIWQCLKMFWVVTTKGGEMLPAASGERPGMPLNTLQGPGWPAQQPQQLRGRKLIRRTSSWHVVEPRRRLAMDSVTNSGPGKPGGREGETILLGFPSHPRGKPSCWAGLDQLALLGVGRRKHSGDDSGNGCTQV